jgi:hypothetical protein
LTGRHGPEYVTCAICGQRVRSERFERHALMHWITSSTDKAFREFYSELRKGSEAATATASEMESPAGAGQSKAEGSA